jgi:hypothetical protein
VKTTSTLLLLAVASPLLGVTITTGGTAVANQGLFTLVSQTMNVNFNDGTLPSVWPVIYDGLSTNVVTGNISSVSAAPPNNTSAYLTIGPSRGQSVTVRFQALMDYFGFYVGSLDNYNFIDFYRGTNLIRTFSGTEIASIGGFPADGNQGRGIYVNVFANGATEHFDKVVLRSTGNAMDSDNHSFRAVERAITTAANPVPEPGTYLAVGLGLIAIAKLRKSVR